MAFFFFRKDETISPTDIQKDGSVPIDFLKLVDNPNDPDGIVLDAHVGSSGDKAFTFDLETDPTADQVLAWSSGTGRWRPLTVAAAVHNHDSSYLKLDGSNTMAGNITWTADGGGDIGSLTANRPNAVNAKAVLRAGLGTGADGFINLGDATGGVCTIQTVSGGRHLLLWPKDGDEVQIVGANTKLVAPINTDPVTNIPSPRGGCIAYDSTDDELQFHNDTNWLTVASTSDVSSAISTHESTYNHANYDTAYGWGDHAGLYAAIGHNHDSDYLKLDGTSDMTGFIYFDPASFKRVEMRQSSSGAGQFLEVKSGDAAAGSNANGGDLTLKPGLRDGSGSNGNVYMFGGAYTGSGFHGYVPDATHDIGQSAANRPANIYASGDAYIGAQGSENGILYLGSNNFFMQGSDSNWAKLSPGDGTTLYLWEGSDTSGTLRFLGSGHHIEWSTDGAGNIGAPSGLRPDNVYAKTSMQIAAVNFTDSDIGNWNTAYGWGDHAGLYTAAAHASDALLHAPTGVAGDDGEFLRFNWNAGSPTLTWEAAAGGGGDFMADGSVQMTGNLTFDQASAKTIKMEDATSGAGPTLTIRGSDGAGASDAGGNIEIRAGSAGGAGAVAGDIILDAGTPGSSTGEIYFKNNGSTHSGVRGAGGFWVGSSDAQGRITYNGSNATLDVGIGVNAGAGFGATQNLIYVDTGPLTDGTADLGKRGGLYRRFDDIAARTMVEIGNQGSETGTLKLGAGGALLEADSSSNFAVKPDGTNAAITADTNENVTCGSSTITTSSTDGFCYIPAASGVPTGTPTAKSGFVPMYYDSTNDDFYIYNGSWVKVALA